MSRRHIAAVLGALTVFGAVFAMAASLGTITSGAVGANNATVTSCDIDGVTTNYTTTWDATDKQYEITSVAVTNIHNNCDGKTLSVSLTDTSGAQIGSGSVTVPTDVLNTNATVSLSTQPSAKLTEGIHVAIA